MTIKQHGGVFGRNPSFNDVSVETLSIAGTTLASTAAELNILDGVTADATEINYLDGASTSVVTASKAVLANASANIAFASGAGIDFSATGDGSGTTSSELFDDYEEGTWTPVYTTGSGAFGTITYDVQAASYVKVGNGCVATFRMRTDSVDPGTATNLLIGGLPFTSGSTPAGSGMVDFATTFGGDTPSALGVVPSATTATIYYRSSANGATLAGNAADLGTGANANFFQGTIVYITG